MNYVKMYKEKTGISFNSKDFEVHHINCNRDDCTIENLLLLPKKLHREYHLALYNFSRSLNMFSTDLYSKESPVSMSNDYVANNFKKLIEVQKKCFMWFYYRDALLKIIPDYYGIANDSPEELYQNLEG